MNYEQTPKSWYNRQGGYIIKTVYNPVVGTYEHQTLQYNRLPNPMNTSLPKEILNDVLDWRNVIRENRKNE